MSSATKLSLVLYLLAAPAAHADELAIGGDSRSAFPESSHDHFASPQRFMLEFKFTPYTPHIDQSAGVLPGKHPFGDLFNPQLDDSGKSTAGQQPGYRLLTQLEFDYQFLHRLYGNFGVGITAGYYRRTTHSFEQQIDSKGNYSSCQVPGCLRSGDQTGLDILPLSLLFIYRFDALANHYHVPIVPYVKLGIAYYVWWIENGDGFGSVAQKPQSAYGGSFGFVLHPGLALQLDVIDRAAARALDVETGINHSYIFCELNYANVNGFGASNKLNLSDTMVNAGLAFEF